MRDLQFCSESQDLWCGLPPPTRPRCDRGHRERWMVFRVSIRGYRCMCCRREVTWDENLAGDHNRWWRERMERLEARTGLSG